MQYELFSDADFQQETPFTGRSVCLLGGFRLAGKAMQQKLQALGADVKPGLSRNLHFVVMGRNVPASDLEYLQQLAFHGYCPRVLSAEQLDDILQGHYSAYMVPEAISKQLHLTEQHYLSSCLTYGTTANPLYTKELYLAPDVSPELYQALGNRGIYANPYIDETTDVLVISDATRQRLQRGESDETLAYIEHQYNASRAQTFRYVMTTESDLRAWGVCR